MGHQGHRHPSGPDPGDGPLTVVQANLEPHDDDVPIGQFDTDLLAARAVEDHNRSLEGGAVDG